MRLLQSLSLTDHQKVVLAKIIDAPTPKIAAEVISGDPNLSKARDQLASLDIIEYSPAQALVKNRGLEIMKDYDLIDDSGDLTPTGQQLAAIGKNTEGAPNTNMLKMDYTLLGQLIK